MSKIVPYYYQAPIPYLVIDFFSKYPDKHGLIAMPTGSGKTIILCIVIEAILARWPNVSIIILSNTKEILEQDHKALSSYLDQDIGLNSAGLGRRDFKQITVAGIQSVYRQDIFNNVQLVLIDEAHTIPAEGEGMYRTFLGKLKRAKLLGLTATKYRLGTGLIYGEDGLFDSLICDYTTMEKFNELVDKGYLCKLRTKSTELKLDTKDLHLRGGEFIDKEMSLAFDRPAITNKAILEIQQLGADYKKWLIFAIDIDHAEHIAEKLLQSGVRAMVVHSKMEMDRDTVIRKFKAGNYRALVNVNILTTGFDSPDIDLVALLRPTQSPVMHVQTIGRGLRVAEGKDHCLVLDFAGNTARLGPINNITVKKRVKGEGGEPVTKVCPSCNMIQHPSARICDVCGHKFVFKVGITSSAGSDVILASNEARWVDVDSVTYALHKKNNAPTSVLVRYHCGLQMFKEWICIEHNGFAGHRAKHWVKIRAKSNEGDLPESDMPISAKDLLDISKKLRTPKQIKVKTANKYPEILEAEF